MDQILEVAVGSTNPNKVEAVEVAFSRAGLKVHINPTEPPSDLPPEPMGLMEITNGAVKRARHALSRVNQAELGVGIEAGIVEINELGIYLDITVAAIVDRMGTVTVGLSPGFMVPKVFMREIIKGKELNEVAEQYYGVPNIGRKMGLIGAVTKGFVRRIDLNVDAVYMALIPRMPWNRDLYGG